MRVLSKIAAFLLLGVSPFLAAGEDRSASATAGFTLDFPGANPSHYEISVTQDGEGTYTSNSMLNKDSEPADPAPLRFILSPKVRDEIFSLVARAKYFAGKVDSGRKDIANTGTKTLTYKDDHRTAQATYNYSPLVPVQELTSIFQGLSATLEFGRRLAFFHRYQKLALDDDLKRMEEMQRDGSLSDVQAIAPVLKAIADDSAVMNVARARALRLLSSAGK